MVSLMALWNCGKYRMSSTRLVNEEEIEIAAKNFLPAPAKVGYDTGKQVRRGIPMAEGNEIEAPLEQWAAAGRAEYQMVEDFKFNAKENSMQVQEKVVTALFAKVGLEKTPPEKWVKRLSNLGQYVAEDAELTASEKKLVASLEEAVKAGAKIEVVSGKANGEAKAKPKKETKVASPNAKGHKHETKVGTVIEREYKGKKITVTATTDGYKCGGKTYSSLTTLAKEITGAASISGPRFFGLV